MNAYKGLHTLGGHLMCAIDFETSGRRPGYHEILQIAVVPLDEELRPSKVLRPFYMNSAPIHENRVEAGALRVNGLDVNDLVLNYPTNDKLSDLLVDWFEALDLPINRFIVPLAHNWAFESSFLKGWLGCDLMDSIFHSHARDSMLLAIMINDRNAMQGLPCPFPKVGIGALAKHFGVELTQAHDALHDCIATAEVYRHLLQMEIQ